MQAHEVSPGTRIIFGDEHLAQYEVVVGEDDPPVPDSSTVDVTGDTKADVTADATAEKSA